MKKAVIVTLEVSARVIVDTDESAKLSENEEKYAVEQAIDYIAMDPVGHLYPENLVKIEEDKSVPFGEGNSGSYDVDITGIEWDLDEDDKKAFDTMNASEDTQIPNEVTLHLTEEEYYEMFNNPDYIPDVLANMFGFCVKSFNCEELENE